jgi:hypothetical protein
MHALLWSTQRKQKKVQIQSVKKRKGRKVVPKYDAFRESRTRLQGRNCVRQKVSGTSRKVGCLYRFIVKQMYLDPSMCQIIYKNTDHRNRAGEECHGTMVAGFKHALGTQLSQQKKDEISTMLWFGLSPA